MPPATPGPSGDATVGSPAPAGYRFGDLLALARRSWVRRLTAAAASKGFSDFRRSDTALMRILARRAEPIGRLGDGLAISRQAARKLADGLVARGYAELVDDAADARRRLVQLTRRGLDYHRALAEASTALNQEVRRLSASDLVAADTVLRAVLTDEDRRLAGSVSPPRPGRP